jgi:hypothetical protein
MTAWAWMVYAPAVAIAAGVALWAAESLAVAGWRRARERRQWKALARRLGDPG